jgi:hypothetical protein
MRKVTIDRVASVAARLAPLPARIEALMLALSEYVQPRLVDRKARRDAIQIEAMAIIRESWALSMEVQRLTEAAAQRGGPRIGWAVEASGQPALTAGQRAAVPE